MKQGISFPSHSDIKNWAYQKRQNEPSPHWNELITNIENAELLLTLVSDKDCPKRAYILNCLYVLVGSSVSKHVTRNIEQIQTLLSKAAASSDLIVLNWASRTRLILQDLRKYDYVEWCGGGFANRDLPTTT